ncbi:MAG: polysaccharide deacetylase family protein [Candidatus Tyrphobacter sp.]
MKAALSLDLDNLWSYLKIRGDERWRDYPSYLGSLVPLVLERLAGAGIRITFFVVGADAERAENGEALRAIVRAGHDVGNHSHRHESWMNRYTAQDVHEELERSERAIADATGVRVSGFRAPGFAVSPAVVYALAERGYRYDASTLPTFVGPLARAYYFRNARLDATAREERATLFGQWSDGLRPNRPHRIANADLLELPVTVTPGVRTPFHVSYLLYVASYSRTAALAYFRSALAACAWTKTMPSLLLHPLDFLGAGDAPGLEFFPGMTMRGEKKRAFVDAVLREYARRFEVVAMDDAAAHVERELACRREAVA